MNKLVSVLLASLFIFAAFSEVFSQEPEEAKPGEKKEVEKKEESVNPIHLLAAHKYFPMEKGNWWEYSFEYKTSEESPIPPGVFDNMPKPRIKVSEVTKNGCRLVQEEENMFGLMTGQEIVIKDGYLLQDMFAIGGKFKALKLPPKKGDKWESEITSPADPNEKIVIHHSVDMVEKLETEAGEFKHVLCVVSKFDVPDSMGADEEATLTMWYAPGIGLVKQIMGAREGSLVLELSKYEVKSAGEHLIKLAAEVSEYVVVANIQKNEEKPEEESEQESHEESEKPGEEETKQSSQVTFDIEKVLKGEIEKGKIVVSESDSISSGKWILFLGKVQKEGYPITGPVLPAQEEILRRVNGVLNPPKEKTVSDKAVEAEMFIVGKAIIREERGTFSYWVFEVETRILLTNKESQNDKPSHVDVLSRDDYEIVENERYILALKETEVEGRKLFRIIGKKPEKYTEEKWKEYKDEFQKQEK